MTKAGKIAWWSIILGVTIVAATSVAIICTTVEPNAIVRYAGLALQLLGLIEIIWSINDVNPLATWARHFRERLSGWFRKPQVASAGATATLMVDARLNGTVHSSVPKPPTLEGVVRALERNVEPLDARIREESVSSSGRWMITSPGWVGWAGTCVGMWISTRQKSTSSSCIKPESPGGAPPGC